MAIAIIFQQRDTRAWLEALKHLDPSLDIRIYPEVGNVEEITSIIAWKAPFGVFRKFPNLKWIASTGAGVEHIIGDSELPSSVRVTRVVDERLAKDMTAFLVAMVMSWIRGLAWYKANEKDGEWARRRYKVPEETIIGIMGMGELGRTAATYFSSLGFPVRGWSRTKKRVEDVEMFAGENELPTFLSSTKVLICLLPLTRDTEEILNRTTFSLLPDGAYLINVARGRHLVDDDLLEALKRGKIAEAALDVFRQEPLPPDHPFWQHPKITVTPHIASITDVTQVAPQILENYRRLQDGQPLLNEVDRKRGY